MALARSTVAPIVHREPFEPGRDNGAMDERGKRLGMNEAVFREVNERLRELGEAFSPLTEKAEFVCECGNGSCIEHIRMPLPDYEEIRANAKRFFVIKGHERPDYEKVVVEREQYVVVEKLPGGPAGLAIREERRR